MIRYPLGEQHFESIRKAEKVYIDKTAYIYKLVNSYKYVFLSRPRRFGKSLLLSTIEAYFEGKKDLFNGLAIEKMEKEWDKYPVLHLQLTSSNSEDPQSLEEIVIQQFESWERTYGFESKGADLSSRFRNIIELINLKAGKEVVVLVDEYDNPLINTIHRKEIYDKNKSLLKSVYSNIKDMDRYIRFAMLTGVSQFTNTSIFSGLNNLTDISLDNEYSAICGFTQEEIKKYLWSGVEQLSKELECGTIETLNHLKKEYDGYHFAEDLTDIYNPYSLLNCLAKKKISNYWMRSGTPTFLIEKLEENPISFPKIFNDKATEIELSERDTVFNSLIALMYQTGYLTIKSFDKKTRSYQLGIPNEEIERSLGSDLFTRYSENKLSSGIIEGMKKSLEEGDAEVFFKQLKSFLASIPGVINHRDMLELNFENIIYVILMAMGADVRAEQSVANGRIDLLIMTEKYIYVVELKYNSSPKKALEQIDSKEYSLPYEYDGRKIFKIGVNFSKKTKNITGWKIVEG